VRSRPFHPTVALRATGDPFAHWAAESKQVRHSLVASLRAAHEMIGCGPGAMLSTSDQLTAASRHAQDWLSGHPCPKADLDGLLAQVSRSFAALGTRLESEAQKATEPHWPAIYREMTGLYRMLADVSTLMRHWST
jgi:hypothetical protein